jgi:hypothetical protein
MHTMPHSPEHNAMIAKIALVLVAIGMLMGATLVGHALVSQHPTLAAHTTQ